VPGYSRLTAFCLWLTFFLPHLPAGVPDNLVAHGCWPFNYQCRALRTRRWRRRKTKTLSAGGGDMLRAMTGKRCRLNADTGRGIPASLWHGGASFRQGKSPARARA